MHGTHPNFLRKSSRALHLYRFHNPTSTHQTDIASQSYRNLARIHIGKLMPRRHLEREEVRFSFDRTLRSGA